MLFKILPIFVLFSAIAIFFYPVWLKNLVPLPTDFIAGVYYPWLDYKWGYPSGVPVKNPITTDVVSLIYPEQMLGVDLMKKGEWPLWNPYILAGTPLLANLQAAPFSPTIFVYFIFEKLTAWSLQIILQHILAGFFVYILLRWWMVSRVGALLAGLAFSFSGFNLIFSQWNGHTLASAFIPLILFFEDRWIKNKGSVNGVGLSIALAFQLLAGYPQTTLYTTYAVVLLWLVRLKVNKEFFVKTVLLSVFFALGLGLAALQLLPAAELWPLSQRGYEPLSFDGAFLPWRKVVTFIAPDYFGNHATGNYWGFQDYTSNTGFIGVVVATLAFLSLKLVKIKKEILFLFIVALFSLTISFPTPVSIFMWKYNVLGMEAASAHRALILFNFAAAMLAGFGLDYFLREKKISAKFSLFFPYLIIGGFGIAAIYNYFTTQGTSEFYEKWIPKYIVAMRNLVIPFGALLVVTVVLFLGKRTPHLKRLLAIVLISTMAFELFWFGWKFTPFSPRDLAFPSTPIFEFLANQQEPMRTTGDKVIPVNLRTPYKLSSLEGYETIHPLRVSQFLATINSGGVGAQIFGRYGNVDNEISHLLDLANTKYYLTHKLNTNNKPNADGEVSSRFTNDRFKLVFEDKSVAVMESKTVLPRAFVVYDWEVKKDGNEILSELLNPSFPFSGKVLLEEVPTDLTSTTPDVEASVNYLTHSEQNSRIKVNTQKDGLLFISDAWFPGWKAFIDGVETKIYRANFMFQAIKVPKGETIVELSYRPESFFNGLKISLILLVVLFLVTFFCKRLYVM